MPTYVDVVNQLSPLAHWRMDTVEAGSGAIKQFVNITAGSVYNCTIPTQAELDQFVQNDQALLSTEPLVKGIGKHSPTSRWTVPQRMFLLNRSVCFIFKPTEPPSASDKALFSHATVSDSAIKVSPVTSSTCKMRLQVNYYSFTDIDILNYNQSYHVVVTYTGGAIKVYLDGVLKVTRATSSSGAIFDYIFRENVHGVLQDLSYHDKVLSQAEIDKLITATKHNNITITGNINESLIAIDFNVRAHRMDTGALTAETTTSSATFSLSVPNIPHYVVVLPDQGTRYETEHAYSLGDKVFPNDSVAYPFYYECTTAGVSGTIEPIWNTLGGSTTADNSVVWTMVEHLIHPVSRFPVVN